MAISRWDPFRELSSTQNELNPLFARTFGTEGGDEMRVAAWVQPVDVAETQDRFVITAEVPGLRPEDVDFSVENSILRIEVPKREEAKPRRIQVKATG